jgi:hypothetical protein
MKYYALIALLAVAVLVLIGCTGCDSNPGNTTVDLSTDRALLCNELGWVAQEDDYDVKIWDGSVRSISSFKVICLTDINGQLLCGVGCEDELIIYLDQGKLNFDGNSVTASFDHFGDYSIRITANSEDPQPVLSLTALSDEAPIDKMYFSLSGGDA